MNETLEKLRKNERITKVLIILVSIIITFIFAIALETISYFIGNTLSAIIGYLFIFFPGIISAIIYYLIFRKVKESIGIAFLATSTLLLIATFYFIITMTENIVGFFK